MIFQLIDDRSRYAVASYVAPSETAKAAIVVFDKAVAAHGVPQRLLSDIGAALNPSRRVLLGQLVEQVWSLGAKAITGKPYKPTTQDKNETLPSDLVPLPGQTATGDTLAELRAQVDAFDRTYNTERPHQGLPGRVTPLTAWKAPPRPTRRAPQARAALVRPVGRLTSSPCTGGKPICPLAPA